MGRWGAMGRYGALWGAMGRLGRWVIPKRWGDGATLRFNHTTCGRNADVLGDMSNSDKKSANTRDRPFWCFGFDDIWTYCHLSICFSFLNICSELVLSFCGYQGLSENAKQRSPTASSSACRRFCQTADRHAFRQFLQGAAN